MKWAAADNDKWGCKKCSDPWRSWFSLRGIARERGNSRDAWSAVNILWRLHFSRVRPAPARNTWYQLGTVENENLASYIHDQYYLYYSIMPKIKILSIVNKRLHQTGACTIGIFWNEALVCLVISLKFINTKFVDSLLNSITTPCMVCCCSQRYRPAKQHPLTGCYPAVPLSRCPNSGSSRQPSAPPPETVPQF